MIIRKVHRAVSTDLPMVSSNVYVGNGMERLESSNGSDQRD